jgi:hypothetical protein
VNDDDTVTMVEEVVPTKYNLDTELRAVIETGENVFDFPLDSAGEIVQDPEAEGEAEG